MALVGSFQSEVTLAAGAKNVVILTLPSLYYINLTVFIENSAGLPAKDIAGGYNYVGIILSNWQTGLAENMYLYSENSVKVFRSYSINQMWATNNYAQPVQLSILYTLFTAPQPGAALVEDVTQIVGGTQVIGELPAGTNVIGGVTQGSPPWQENLIEVGGAAISLGQKDSPGSLPITVANDQTVALGQTTMADSLPATIASDQATYHTIYNNQISVGTTATQLPSFNSQLVLLKNDDGNTNDIFIGNSAVTTSNGFKLIIGQTLVVSIANTSYIYAVSPASGNTLDVLGFS